MTLAIVPARAGSVGIPGKNLRRVAGRSLLEWAILHARQAHRVHAVAVTTDGDAIEAEALRLGAMVVRRPPELATSSASLDAAILHALDALTYEGVVVLLQPTVPYRPVGLVDECIRHLGAEVDCVLTARRLHFVWTGEGRPLVPTRANRQDQPAAELLYHEDGAVFAFRASMLRRTGCRVSGRVLVLENGPTVDVDALQDLDVAEALIRGA